VVLVAQVTQQQMPQMKHRLHNSLLLLPLIVLLLPHSLLKVRLTLHLIWM